MKRLLWLAPLFLMAFSVLWVGSQGCHNQPSLPQFANTMTPTPTATTCSPPTLFNGCETLAENGTWTSTTSTISLSTLNLTQGTHSLDVDITTGSAYNQNMMILNGFSPSVWNNVYQLIMDLTVDPSVVAGEAYSQFDVVADSSSAGKYFQLIASVDPNLVAGSQSVTWVINFGAGTLLPTDPLSKLTFIYNRSTPSAGQAIGNIYVDNIRLVSCP